MISKNTFSLLCRLHLLILAVPVIAHAQSSGGSGSSGGSQGGSQWGQTYQQRSAERFDIISYLSDQKKIRSAQDAKYGSVAKGSGIHPDWAFTFMYEKASLTRDGNTLGSGETSFMRAQFLMDDFISQGTTRRLINIDLGVEVFYGQTQHFAVDSSSTQAAWQTTESGAGLVLRPFGRSSQDTGLMFKVGYMNLSETGLWSLTNTTANTLGSMYFGAEAKLYLLPFLGGWAEYDMTPSSNSSAVNGSWSLTRWRYGAFLEFKLLAVGAVVTSSDYNLAPSSGAQSNDYDKGYSLFASLFF